MPRASAAVASSQCWIGVVVMDEAQAAAVGGFLEIHRGKAGPLERMRAGDRFAIYSPRAAADGAAVQAFTALGRIRDGVVYQAGGGNGGCPFRLAADYEVVTTAPIRPLIATLEFVRNKTHWGAAFRFGFLRVPDADFGRIVAALHGGPPA